MPNLIIADDNEDFSEFLAMVAQKDGWNVSRHANGKQLTRNLEDSDEAALLIVDIHMPEMDGIEAIEKLKETRRPIRVRFISGGQDASILAADLIAKARNLNVGRSLYKPISKSDFGQVLEEERALLDEMRRDTSKVLDGPLRP